MLAPDEKSIRVRPISSELSILTNCDGSARVKQGNSSVMVGIWGPVDVRPAKEDPEKCVIETSVKAATGHGCPRDTMFEEALRLTSEQMVIMNAHPRTSIQVIAHIESEDGSIMSVMQNALCLALMDAGIPMRGMFGGLTCVELENGELAWDPTAEEEEESIAKFSFVYESGSRDVVYMQSVGESTIEQQLLILQKGRQIVQEVFSFYRESFEKLLRKDVKYQMMLPPIIKGEVLDITDPEG